VAEVKLRLVTLKAEERATIGEALITALTSQQEFFDKDPKALNHSPAGKFLNFSLNF